MTDADVITTTTPEPEGWPTEYLVRFLVRYGNGPLEASAAHYYTLEEAMEAAAEKAKYGPTMICKLPSSAEAELLELKKKRDEAAVKYAEMCITRLGFGVSNGEASAVTERYKAANAAYREAGGT